MTGYSIDSFLASDKCSKWSPDTRRCYANCLQDLLVFVKQNGDLTRKLLATWQTQMSQGYGCTALNVHMYDQLLEMEQESISWQNENHTI